MTTATSPSSIPGKIIKTRHLMTEANAKARDPNAVPISSDEERHTQEKGDEAPANTHTTSND
ncbi:MAG: hypothetical protein JF606_22310 [Burkholderiales bacterium]|nr:hypothetical protein [Burkholderiales bacterium]